MSFNPLSWIKELFEIRKLKQEIDTAKRKKRREESGIVTEISEEDIIKYDHNFRILINAVHASPQTTLCDSEDDESSYSAGKSKSSVIVRIYYKLTDQSLKKLKSEGDIPDDILEKLDTLKNQEFTAPVEFFNILKSTIDEQTFHKQHFYEIYKSAIVVERNKDDEKD